MMGSFLLPIISQGRVATSFDVHKHEESGSVSTPDGSCLVVLHGTMRQSELFMVMSLRAEATVLARTR